MRRGVLITGCTGLVGHGVCLHFLQKGYEVWGTSRRRLVSRHPRFHPVCLDFSQPDSMEQLIRALKRVSTVVHSAAKIPGSRGDDEQDQRDYLLVNTRGTLELLILSHRYQVERFVYLSSTSVVEQSPLPISETHPYQPENTYIISKIGGEHLCEYYRNAGRVCTVVLRIRAPYGYQSSPRSVIPRFIHLAKSDQPITLWGSGSRQQVFTFVEDIGRACRYASESDTGGIFNITGKESVTMWNVAETVLRALPDSRSVIFASGEPDPQEGRQVAVSIRKAGTNLGFEPVFNLRQGVERVVKPDDDIVYYEIQDTG